MNAFFPITKYFAGVRCAHGIVLGMYDGNVIMFDPKKIRCCQTCVIKRFRASSFQEMDRYSDVAGEDSVVSILEELSSMLSDNILECIDLEKKITVEHTVLCIPGCSCCMYGEQNH